jgi:acyl-CoA synthetase (AMP-forming)/AMP-acid ligase II
VLTQLLQQQMERCPAAPFVVTDDSTYTYAEVASLSRRFASELQARGIGQGDHVALIAGNCAAFLVAWFGINIAGGVAVMLNNELIAEGLCYSVRQSDAKLIVADVEWMESKQFYLDEEQKSLPIIVIQSDARFFATLTSLPEAPVVAVDPGALCSIIYTSGTTGLPKGVMCSHAEYLATGRHTVTNIGLTTDDRIFVYLPLFHSNPQMFAVAPALMVGASLALQRKFSATSFFDAARRLNATGCTFIGAILAILLARYPEGELNHAMRFCIGGGVASDVWEAAEHKFGFRVHELYGLTETGGWVTGNSADLFRVGSVGKVRPDVDVRIFDEHDREVPAGDIGEIVVRPLEPFVILSGYYKKAEETLMALRNLWYHTGDLGRFDEDRFLYFHGRSNEMIRRGGKMISPAEIEAHMLKMTGIKDCAIVGVPDSIMGEEIKVVIVAEERLEVAGIRAFLSQHLPRYMLPRYVEFIDTIARTQTGKIQRKRLRYLDGSVIDVGNRGTE